MNESDWSFGDGIGGGEGDPVRFWSGAIVNSRREGGEAKDVCTYWIDLVQDLKVVRRIEESVEDKIIQITQRRPKNK